MRWTAGSRLGQSPLHQLLIPEPAAVLFPTFLPTVQRSVTRWPLKAVHCFSNLLARKFSPLSDLNSSFNRKCPRVYIFSGEWLSSSYLQICVVTLPPDHWPGRVARLPWYLPADLSPWLLFPHNSFWAPGQEAAKALWSRRRGSQWDRLQAFSYSSFLGHCFARPDGKPGKQEVPVLHQHVSKRFALGHLLSWGYDLVYSLASLRVPEMCPCVNTQSTFSREDTWTGQGMPCSYWHEKNRNITLLPPDFHPATLAHQLPNCPKCMETPNWFHFYQVPNACQFLWICIQLLPSHPCWLCHLPAVWPWTSDLISVSVFSNK